MKKAPSIKNRKVKKCIFSCAFIVCIGVMQWRLKARLFTSMCCHCYDISCFSMLLDFSLFSVKPDILALKHYFLSFGIFSLQKCTLSFSCWRYCATFEMMEIWKFSIQSYKSNFTLTLRNIQRGVSHMRGRYILWHWLVLYICMFVAPFLLRLLAAVGAWIVHDWQLLFFSSLGMLFGMSVFRLWNHREGMCAFKSLHFDFSLFSPFLVVLHFSAKASTRIKF